jgi:hypothetical protein
MALGGAGLALSHRPAEAAQLQASVAYAQYAPGEGSTLVRAVRVHGAPGLAGAVQGALGPLLTVEPPPRLVSTFERPAQDHRRFHLAHAYEATGPPQPATPARA